MIAVRTLTISFAAAAILLSSAGASTTAQPSGARLMGKHLFAMHGHRTMNLICFGHGVPTVIFEQGSGANILTWQRVADATSKFARVCFYDRAGFGYSAPSGRGSTAAIAVEDLHALLGRAGVRQPVILVGHSLGGLYATLYADKYSKDVAGLVLIEPSFAEQDKDEDASEHLKDEIAFKENIAQLRACAAFARAGKLASETHEECFAFAPNRNREEKAFLAYQYVRPYRYEALASENESQHSADGRSDVNSRQESAARRFFGDKPMIVLTAAQADDPTATSTERAAAARLWRAWKLGHDRLAGRSMRGQSKVVTGTGHFVQLDQPQAVIDAIEEVIGLVRGKANGASRKGN